MDKANLGEKLLEMEQEAGLLRRPQLVCLADVTPTAVKWLWDPYLPLGKLTLLEGDPKVGKSWLAMNLAAIISRGDPFPGPDGVPRERRDPGTVVYLSAEDALADTVRVRLDAAGADVARIYALSGIEVSDLKTGKTHESRITLTDLDMLEAMLKEVRPVLVVVDPIQAYLGAGVDMHRSNEVRPILAGLSRLAETYLCAVLVIRHLTKGQTDRAMYRGLGSIDFAAAARSILLAGRDPKNPAHRVLVHLACSNAPEGPSLGYELQDGAFLWTGLSDLTAETLLAPDRGEDCESGGARDEAEDFLRSLLAGEPIPAKRVHKEAKEAGIAERTLWRAKKKIGVRVHKEGAPGGGQWVWSLSEGCQETPKIVKAAKVATVEKVAALSILSESGSLGEGGTGKPEAPEGPEAAIEKCRVCGKSRGCMAKRNLWMQAECRGPF